MFTFCTDSYAPLGAKYNLPSWVVEAADSFVEENGFDYNVLLHEEHMVVHDALHYLCNIPPTSAGEEDITVVEFTIMEFTLVDWEFTNLYLTKLSTDQTLWFLNWYSKTKNILLEFDLAEYLYEREASLH